MAFQCEIKEQAAQPTLTLRTRLNVQELQAFLGKAYGAVYQYLGGMGESPAGPPFAAYHNMDMANLDVEAGFPVSRPFPAKGEIQAGEIPAGRAATCLYTGPYDKMIPAYEALTQWIKEKGVVPSGVSYEMYLNDPEVTPPENLMTQIVFPLR